ncbi:hypothetical protein BGZ52_003720 [Haplosporangium bisporale]|nr:hypothetical protein BGZ52_003720 [Haplosporangium bisporale]
MFNEDSAHQSANDKINKIHSLGLAHKLSIPRMAIIGEQSSGKSSVLEAITQLSFPRDKDMCTRFAILVNLRRNCALKADELSARIEGEEAFNARFKHIEPPMTFHGVIKEAVSVLCTNGIHISDRVLELTISGPTQSPLTVIDLPGFINTTLDNQDKGLPDIIYAINRRYIKEPRTIILAVVQANADLNTSRALSEAAEHDCDGERTVTIVTKPDRIENGLLPDWIEVILNRRKTMKLGYLVMRNASYEQKEQSWDQARLEEDKYFESDLWNAVPADRKGRVAVKRLLGNMLYEHVSRELPALKREVDAALDSFRSELKSLGTPIASTDEARENLSLATLDLQPHVIGFLNADYDHKYIAEVKNKPIASSSLDLYFVRSSLLTLYHEYRMAMGNACNSWSKTKLVVLVARYKGNDLPGFVSFTTFKNIINGHYLDGWRAVTKEHVRKMHRHLSDALLGFIAHTADAAARDVFTHVFDRFSRLQANEIDKTIQDIFEDESTPFTLCRHYLETIDKERAKIKQTPVLPRESSVIDISEGSEDLSTSSSSGTPQPSRSGSPKTPHPSRNSNLAHPSQNSDLAPPFQNGGSTSSSSNSASAPSSLQNGSLAATPLQNGFLAATSLQNGSLAATPLQKGSLAATPLKNGSFPSLQTNGSASPLQTGYSLSPPQTGDSPSPPQTGDSSSPLQTSEMTLTPSQQWQKSDWNDKHTTEEMVPCLQAYLTTARERIVDKVLMETIERHMIKRIKEYFVMLHKVTNGELQCMLESPTLKHRRHDLEAKIIDFQNILNEL